MAEKYVNLLEFLWEPIWQEQYSTNGTQVGNVV